MTAAPQYDYPSLPRRLTAMLYDGLLVIALVAVANALALGITHQLSGGSIDTLPPAAVRIVTLVSVFGFYCVFWIKDGQTLGMQAWRIKLVRAPQGEDAGISNVQHSKRVTLPRAILRCCAACLSLACLGLGYLWCLFDPQRRYWHCRLSGTQLILLPKAS